MSVEDSLAVSGPARGFSCASALLELMASWKSLTSERKSSMETDLNSSPLIPIPDSSSTSSCLEMLPSCRVSPVIISIALDLRIQSKASQRYADYLLFFPKVLSYHNVSMFHD